MALYENIFIARQDVPQTQVETLTNQFPPPPEIGEELEWH